MESKNIGQPEQIDLRAHHLYSLLQQYRFPKITSITKKFKLALLGYQNKELANHINETIGAIIDGTIQKVRIIAGHDVICEKCPQRRESHCKVAGKNWSSEFLEAIDQNIAKNIGFEIGSTYASGELIKNIKQIKKGLRKTAIKLPFLYIKNKTGY